MTTSKSISMLLKSIFTLFVLGIVVQTQTQAQAATTFKIATLSPEGTGWMKALRTASKAVEERTSGEVKFKIYPGGVMGDDKAVLRKMRVGQLHGAALTSGGVMQPYPDIALYNLPLVFRSQEEVQYVRQRMDAKLMEGLRAKKFVGFGLAEVGFAYPMTQQRVASVAGFRNSRVWAPDNDPGAMKAYSSFNVTPIPLPIADVLTGLQTGLIDSIGSPAIGAIALQWHTQVQYALELPLMYVYGLLTLAERPFNRLSEAHQAIVTEEFSAAVKSLDASSRNDDQRAKDALSKQGIEWVEPSDEEMAEWVRMADDANAQLIRDNYVSEAMYQELVGHLQKFRSASDGPVNP